ncbi:hypothetical protein BDA96_04G261000 [Sorghum bicolor]|jgi:hypothetical protein|uniref:Uncharacterized protein n=2 Tax=Sorghum bicolor TaxID=4558 RepID=A0A921UJV6_SORBI|nr:hypothetical protein BDA96_04G261000 [Sorghum bicolor]KXG30798.1 hypothetical protein SORBI_3004G245300 [Sorghum bicolor]
MATSISRSSFVLPLLIAVLMLLAVSGSTARQLDLDRDRSTSTGGESAFGVGGRPIIQTIKRLYLQQLATAGPSCDTYDTNNPNCH